MKFLGLMKMGKLQSLFSIRGPVETDINFIQKEWN